MLVSRRMFGWFKQKPKWMREDDRIYQRRAAADEALVADAIALLGGPRAIVVASFFPASLERIAALLSARGSESCPLPDPDLAQRGPARDKSYLWDLTRATDDLRHKGSLDGVSATLLIVEHHPHPRPERAIFGLLDELAVDKPITARFYGAFDDGLFSLFSSERLTQLMTSLGMTEDECISHPMVTRAIVNAQAKIEKRLPESWPAHSEAEWFRKNHS